jgi:aldehyde dehydrogenase (NAD+)
MCCAFQRIFLSSNFNFRCCSIKYFGTRRDFGPVLTIQTFRTVDEVIQKANNTPYGLAAGVWTDKGSKIFNLTTKLRAGVVWANTYNKFDPTSPFGGYKESGFGSEGGVHGLEAYLK